MKAFGLAIIGRDVEVNYTAKNEPVANLSLAFAYGRKGEDGNRPTQWVKAALWGARAEALAPYLLKGTKVAVTLRDVRLEEYQTQNGNGTNMVAEVDDVELAGSPQQQDGGQQRQAQRQAPQQRQQQPQRQAPVQRAAAPAARQASAQRPASGFDDMDDDIPF